MAIQGPGFPSEILHREGLYASEDFREESRNEVSKRGEKPGFSGDPLYGDLFKESHLFDFF